MNPTPQQLRLVAAQVLENRKAAIWLLRKARAICKSKLVYLGATGTVIKLDRRTNNNT